MTRHTAVLLVDDRRRDLLANVLLAHHLKRHGIAAVLEPINAWQAALGAYKPDLFVFNHLSARHLADYSRRLHKLGVLTAVLPSEGILYNPDELEYNSKSYFPQMHCDYYFCWNRVHQEALIRNGFCADSSGVKAVGIPRFDFYREPWRRIFERPKPVSGRPVILMCGNFPLAHYHELPPEHADRFFAKWVETVTFARDYRNAIRANHSARARFLSFVEALLREDKYEVIVRPHPREGKEFYQPWIDLLPPRQRQHMRFAQEDSIADLILNCDLQVSCEHCTTALESWIVGQPTIELVFEKHSFWYNTERAGINVECAAPEDLPGMVEEALTHPTPPVLRDRQQAHLEKWCGAVDGTSARQVAQIIALENHPQNKRLRLGVGDYRRGLKLKAYRAIGKPYTYFPLHQLTHALFRSDKAYSRKMAIYRKSISPVEVRQAMAMVEHCG
jgi:surface carbohydrate biosynthesis protein